MVNLTNKCPLIGVLSNIRNSLKDPQLKNLRFNKIRLYKICVNVVFANEAHRWIRISLALALSSQVGSMGVEAGRLSTYITVANVFMWPVLIKMFNANVGGLSDDH